MWNWVWGLKSLVCSESMHVLARLLIVQPDHTYANVPSWSHSTERITASIRHTESLYTGPYNHSAELRASGKERKCFSFSLHQHSKTREGERARGRAPMYRCTDAFESFSKTFSYQTRPPMHRDRVQLFGKYLIVWPCVFETWRMSMRSCF